MTTDFKPGDMVEFINPGNCKQPYTVKSFDGRYVDLIGIEGGWYPSRLRLVKESPSFSAGDSVIFIHPSRDLQVYTVESFDGVLIHLKELGGSWLPSRFRKVSVEEKIAPTIDKQEEVRRLMEILSETTEGSEKIDREVCRSMCIPWNSVEEFDNCNTFPLRVHFTRDLNRAVTLLPKSLDKDYAWFKVSQGVHGMVWVTVRIYEPWSHTKFKEYSGYGQTLPTAVCATAVRAYHNIRNQDDVTC